MSTFNLATLRLPHKTNANHYPPALRQQADRRFLKGPIPWGWLTDAAKLPGHAFHVAIALCFKVGVTRSETVTLTTTLVAELGVDRHAKYRALKALEQAGLVTVVRQHGKNPLITLRSPKRAKEAAPE